MNEIRLFPWELDSMGEYSCSIPTGTTLWKMWKCNKNAYRPNRPGEKPYPPLWVVGQYIPHKNPEFVGIRWFKVKILEGPRPLGWVTPDWSNFQRYRREADALRKEERRKQKCCRCQQEVHNH